MLILRDRTPRFQSKAYLEYDAYFENMNKKEDFKLADILLPYQRKFISSPQRKKIWISSR